MEVKKKKCYIIIANSIRGIGGGDIYTNNIIKSAKQRGYYPIAIHDGYGSKVLIKELEPYDKNICEYLIFPPSFFTKRKLNGILRMLMDFVAEADADSIIESQTVIEAVWGELMAERLGCRHIVRPLPEHHDVPNVEMYNFLKFKYDRHELAGIHPNIIPAMFADFWNNNKPPIGYYLRAYSTNVLVNEQCPPEFVMEKADYTIGMIGRVNKPFVLPMCNSLVQFAKLHKDKHINILLIGGRPQEKAIIDISNIFSSIKNINLQITGQMYPIPVGLVRQADVFVSSAGSCSVSYNCGVPTISIDTDDHKAIGVFGKTTKHSLFRGEDEPPIDICTLLEEILINRIYIKENFLNIISVDFSEHWNFVEQMPKRRDYFDVMSIPSVEKEEWKKYSYSLFNKLSYKNYMKLLKFYRALSWLRV